MMQALNIEGLYKHYSNGTVAIKDINLAVKQGDFFALLGANGAGKSTTIGIITSLITKSAGSVKVFGHSIDTNLQKAKSYIGLVPQEINLFIFEKVINTLIYQAGYYGIPGKIAYERAEYYLKKLGLWDQRNKVCIQLSGGMKRRLMIARALVHEPKLLILDEPTAGVDIELRHIVWDFLKTLNQQGTTIILTTHYLEEAEQLCQNVAIIDHGQIIENTTMSELLSRVDCETLICSIKSPISNLPENSTLPIRYIDPYQIEVDIQKNNSLNKVFEYLQAHSIEVVNIHNKANRLETLFINLTKNSFRN